MTYERILIIRTDRIGDVLLSTPAIQAVRQSNPNAHIAFMTRPYTKDIVIGNPYVDEVIVYDKDGIHRSVLATVLFALRLRRYKFDIALVLHSTVRINWLVFFAGIPRRIGYDRKAGWLLTDRLPYVKSEGSRHEMEYTLDIVRAAGITCDSKDAKPFIPVGKDAEDFVNNFLKENKVYEKDILVGIHPSASCPSRRWPTQRFAQLADKLIEETGYKLIILAVADDLAFADKVKDDMRNEAIIVKDFSIVQTAAILKRCKVFISTDTGPAHIAAAMGAPCITIFGRKQPGLGPARWKPLGKDIVVLHKDVGCKECPAHKCKKHFACLLAVTVDEVLDAAKQFF